MKECIDQLKLRMKHVKAATGEGYGDKHSLRHYVNFSRARLDYYRPCVLEFKDELNKDKVMKQIDSEFEELTALVEKAQKVVDDPTIEGVDVGNRKS